MLLKGGITGINSLNDIQVQKPISHLIFRKRGTANTVVSERIVATIKKKSGGEESVIPNLKVDDVAILSQFENGYIFEQVGGGTVEYCALLEITLGDAVSLDGDNYLSLDFSNLEAGATYEVYGLEAINVKRTFLKYTSREIVGASVQQTALGLPVNSVAFAIKNNGALAKVRLFTDAGQQVTFLPEELKTIAREMNGMTKGPDVLVEGDAINQAFSGGATGFFIIPTQNYSKMEIETVGGTALEYITVNAMQY